MSKFFVQIFFEVVIHLSGIGSIADFADYHQGQVDGAVQRIGAIGFQGCGVEVLLVSRR